MRGSAPASYATVNKHWEWLGWWQIIFVMFGIVLYYSVVISWCLNYFFFSFNLSWGSDTNSFFFKEFLMKTSSPFQMGDVRSPILFGLAIIWFLNWFIVFSGVQKGLERANKIFMPILFILVAVLSLWSLKLPGSREGIALYLKPDLSKIWSTQVWRDAFSQIFFSLSLGFGIMIAYASYLPRRSAIVKDSIIISLANCFFSVFVGFSVFAVLGYMAQATAQPIETVVTKEIGLAFVTFPKAISLLPAFSSRMFGVLFFLSLVIAGLSSSISILEAFTAGIVDKFRYARKPTVSILCISGFLGSIIFATQGGLNWIDIVDHFLNKYGLVLAGLLECILLGWVYKAAKLREHINQSQPSTLSSWWDFAIRFVIPAVLLTILLNSLVEEFKAPYGNYPLLSIILIGRDWLIFTLFSAFIVAARDWKIPPHTRQHL